jgi:hypothetical protein
LADIGEAAFLAGGLPRTALPPSAVAVRAKCLSQRRGRVRAQAERIQLGAFGQRPVTFVNCPAPGRIECRRPAAKGEVRRARGER